MLTSSFQHLHNVLLLDLCCCVISALFTAASRASTAEVCAEYKKRNTFEASGPRYSSVLTAFSVAFWRRRVTGSTMVPAHQAFFHSPPGNCKRICRRRTPATSRRTQAFPRSSGVDRGQRPGRLTRKRRIIIFAQPTGSRCSQRGSSADGERAPNPAAWSRRSPTLTHQSALRSSLGGAYRWNRVQKPSNEWGKGRRHQCSGSFSTEWLVMPA